MFAVSLVGLGGFNLLRVANKARKEISYGISDILKEVKDNL